MNMKVLKPKKLNTDKLNSVNCNKQPVFKYLGYQYGHFPELGKASKEVLSLPMHPFLEKSSHEQVVDMVKSVVEI
ncbi:MAG: DegT/DnrJ/EryC1/StrS family aminotransferase [Candidatus Woykebacteria bacterium]